MDAAYETRVYDSSAQSGQDFVEVAATSTEQCRATLAGLLGAVGTDGERPGSVRTRG